MSGQNTGRTRVRSYPKSFKTFFYQDFRVGFNAGLLDLAYPTSALRILATSRFMLSHGGDLKASLATEIAIMTGYFFRSQIQFTPESNPSKVLTIGKADRRTAVTKPPIFTSERLESLVIEFAICVLRVVRPDTNMDRDFYWGVNRNLTKSFLMGKILMDNRFFKTYFLVMDHENSLTDAINSLAQVLREKNVQLEIIEILHRIENKQDHIMSKIADFAAAVQQSFTDAQAAIDGVGTNIDAVSTDVATIVSGVAALDAKITQLQNSPGGITAEDQATLDGLQILSKTLSTNAAALKAKTDALKASADAVDLTPPPAPAAP